MVVIPAGQFRMGCVSGQDCWRSNLPVHDVTIPTAFAVSKYEVTFADYDRFTGSNRVDDMGWGRGRRPVINVSWDDAQEYVAWLSRQTGQTYRLLSEAEWEYVARAGSSTAYCWGNGIGSNRASCDGTDCGDQWEYTAPAGSFPANAFGVHDMHGNVSEWVEDCWNESYAGAPQAGNVAPGSMRAARCTIPLRLDSVVVRKNGHSAAASPSPRRARAPPYQPDAGHRLGDDDGFLHRPGILQ